ncbi:fungal-specific transcription factor domain-containing protein [Cladorrhinum sp. PSN332]|nr:fungal-specific transcription factor domain-containing protein [Cladorrhinum sp. PSN332]
MDHRITQQQFAPPAPLPGTPQQEPPQQSPPAGTPLPGPPVHGNALLRAPDLSARKTKPRKRASAASDGTASGEKKQRISRSCDQCHGKRMKCSGFKPCQTCSKRDINCTYDRPYIRGIAKTPPPPPDNGQTRNLAQPFDERGKPIRDRSWALRACDLCRSKQMACSGKLPCDACFNIRVQCTYRTRASRRTLPPQDSDEEADADPSLQWEPRSDAHSFRRLPQDIAPYQLPTRYAREPTPPVTFLQKAWERIAEALNSPTRVGGDKSAPELALPAGDQPFDTTLPLDFPHHPAKWFEMQEKFQNGWTETFHLLHRPTVKSWLERVYHNWSSNAALDNELGPAKTTIALMTMAIGTMFNDRPFREKKKDRIWDRLWTLNNGDQLFLTTIRLTDSEPGPPKLESIQARILQALYLLGTCRLSQAWYVFGNAIHMINALGLHRRRGGNRGLGADITENPDYAKIQCERRTFWSAYVIDKEIALMSGRPCYFSNDAVDQEYPDPVNDEDMGPSGPFRPHQSDCYMEAITEQAKLNQIVDRIMREVYTLRDVPDEWRLECALRIGRELEEWHDRLPFLLSHLKPSMLHNVFRRQSTLLNLTYRHAQMLLYRIFITAPYPPEGEKKQIHYVSCRTCFDAARIVLHITLGLAREQDNKRDKSHFPTLLYAHHVAYVAASTVFMIPHIRERQKLFGGSNFRDHSKSDPRMFDLAERTVKSFVEDTNRHSPCRRWSIILEELRDECIRQVPGMGLGRPKTPEPTQQTNGGGEQSDGEEDDDEEEDEDGGGDDGEVASPDEQLLEDALRAHWEAETPRQSNPVLPNRPPSVTHSEGGPLPTITPRLWDKWRVTDWLDLDAAAFGPIPTFERPDVPDAAPEA